MSITRKRSNFRITICPNDDGSITIFTTSKWKDMIQFHNLEIEDISPKGWQKTRTGDYYLWIPEDWIDNKIIDDFISWAENVNDYIWLNLNKNTKDYFNESALDYCVATDWNYSFENNKRTSVGEAEYQMKYCYTKGLITQQEAESFADILITAVLKCCDIIPIKHNNLLVTTIPALQEDQSKLSWAMAKCVKKNLNAQFLVGTLLSKKPQTKQMSIEQKISVWRNIFSDDTKISLSQDIQGKDILIVDDLYQSGVSIWSYAEYLKENGARTIIGLAAVKAQKDSDNVG